MKIRLEDAKPRSAASGPAATVRRIERFGGEAGVLVARLLAAVAGGYAVANLAVIAVGMGLPMARVDAVHTGFLLGFGLHAAAVVWAFAAASARRAWLGLAVAAVACLVVIGIAHLAGGG